MTNDAGAYISHITTYYTSYTYQISSNNDLSPVQYENVAN